MHENLSDDLVERLYRSPDLREQLTSLSDRLAAEQLRRHEFYEWLDEDKKAEFIDGEVVVHSPVVKRHADSTKWLTKVLDTFVEVRELGYIATEKLLVRLKRNDFEPDVVFWKSATADSFTEDQLFFPAPDLAVEVLSPGTESHDRTTKHDDYAANGVREYWIVDSKKKTIERNLLQANGTYLLVETVQGATAPLVSEVVPGFAVPLAAAFDRKANLAAIRTMLDLAA